MGNSGGKGNKGKGTKGEGKGGKGCPPKAAWTTYNPDPAVIRPSQWGQWHPGNTQLQLQLKSLVADGGWMAVPGAMFSGSLKMLATKSVTETKNTFSALQEDSESPEDSISPELAEASQDRSPGSPPSRDSAPCCSSPLVCSRRTIGRTPVLKPGELRPATEQMRRNCKLDCCTEPSEKMLNGVKSGDEQAEGVCL